MTSEEKKEYFKKYYQNHKDKKKEYGVQYYNDHKEEIKKRDKQYRQNHKEEIKKRDRDRYEKRKDKLKEYRIRYYQEHKNEFKEYGKRRYQVHKEEIIEYAKQRYRMHKEDKKKYDKNYRKTPKGKITNQKHNSKRKRELSYNILNDPFEGSVGHHINKKDVIFIPVKLHEKHRHYLKRPETMIIINRIAFEYLTNTIKQI